MPVETYKMYIKPNFKAFLSPEGRHSNSETLAAAMGISREVLMQTLTGQIPVTTEFIQSAFKVFYDVPLYTLFRLV